MTTLLSNIFSGSITVNLVAPPATLREQVEVMFVAGETGPTTAPTKVVGVDTLPTGATVSGTIVTLGNNCVFDGWTGVSRIDITGTNVTCTNNIIVDPGTLPSGQYPIQIRSTANNTLIERNTIQGSGKPVTNAGGPASGSAILNSGPNTTIRRNRIYDFPADGIKSDAINVLIEENLIGSPRAIPIGTPAYNPALTYAANVLVSYNGRLFRSFQAVPISTFPSGTTADTAYWDGLDPHTDVITINGGSGKIRFNAFATTFGIFFGATQFIRVIRNTSTSIFMGEVQVYGNVFKPWPGAYPLDAGVIRPVAGTAHIAGSVVIQSASGVDRFYRALGPAQGAANYPLANPALWEETVDINAPGPTVFAHNWVARGTSAPFGGIEQYKGLNELGPNFFEDDNTVCPPEDGAIVRTMAEPTFGGNLTYTAPVAALVASKAVIVPLTYGKFRTGGITIDACVIRIGSRIAFRILTDGSYVIQTGAPVTVVRDGSNYTMTILDAAGVEMAGTIYVAAGTATVSLVATPVITALPTLSGLERVGSTLTVTPGPVTGGGTNSYQWQRNEVNIPGATSTTYLMTDADASMAIRCVQTATNGPASDVEFSAETGPILFGFTLLTEAGSSTITAFPTLRVSLNNGSWQTLTAAGLTISQDVTGRLRVSGAALAALTAGQTARFSIEDSLHQPGEPFNAVNSIDAIYADITTGASPVNTTLPGMPLSPTIYDTPVGATK